MPRLAVFPKCFMDALCVSRQMSLRQWIEIASNLNVDGLEFYAGFLDLQEHSQWVEHRKIASDHGLPIPMLCCSPDFTHPDPGFRQRQIELQKSRIGMAAELGAQFCRVLSGQRRPGLSEDDGIAYAADCIEACLPYAAERGVTLNLENHYKDNYWQYPEFAQQSDVFCKLVDRIVSPAFGVNFDPSNTILAGEDPIALLKRVRHRVVTMHASDRYLARGTMEELRAGENAVGYAKLLEHGEIGKGLNDYDKIFAELSSVGFDGWISIEDGMDGMDQLRRSAEFLRNKIPKFWSGAARKNESSAQWQRSCHGL
jgi:sugar phosphate isomerase/epimerase